MVVDGIGGELVSKALALGGSLTTLGYSASRKTTIASQISSCHKSASGVSTCSVNGEGSTVVQFVHKVLAE